MTEGAVDGYRLSGVECTATTASGGPGSSTFDVSGSTASIHLVATEHVTCVFTNQYVPPPGGLVIQKITRGGAGTFRYTVAPVSGGDRHHVTATATDPGVPAVAEPSLARLDPGTYTIRERAPTSADGRWRPVKAVCSGERLRSKGPVTVQIRSGENVTCTFVNRFVPRGSISVSKISLGNTGTFAFLIGARSGKFPQYLQHATTTAQGSAAGAVPATPADATDHLRLGRYVIVEQLPLSNPLNAWAVTWVDCNGVLTPFDRGAVEIRLTRAHPHVHCAYTDTFTHHPPPTPPTPPTPPGPPIYEQSDLVVTKNTHTRVAIKGEPVTYRITVTNRGPDPAQRVIVDEQLPRGTKLVSIHSSVGHCRRTPRPVCSLGTLKRGARVVVTMRLIPQRVARRMVNRVVVGTSTAESNLANNVAVKAIKVIAPLPPPPPIPPPPGLG